MLNFFADSRLDMLISVMLIKNILSIGFFQRDLLTSYSCLYYSSILLASRNSTCFRNRTFWFLNIISTTFYYSKWKSYNSTFDFHTVMYIDGSSNAKTECRYKVGVLYFRFIVTLLTKQKWISQKKRAILQYKTFGLWFSCKFSEILNKLNSCTFKAKCV